MSPYYADDTVTLYHGDMRKVLPALDLRPDCIVTDPPYGETTLTWDRWPEGWAQTAAGSASSMWCFGSMRMFLDHRDEFETWKFGHDIVWEKHNGPGFTTDRFRRVHEHVVHWYRGPWRAIEHTVPRQPATFDRKGRTASARQDDRAAHTGSIAARAYIDDGMRLARSVLQIRSVRGDGRHPTEKPVELLDLLIRYACPPGGVVLDPFAGSGSTAVAARACGRRAVLIEAEERYCEAIARRLSAAVLPLEVTQ